MPTKKATEFKKAGSINVRGQTLSNLMLYYEGRTLTPLHFGMEPKTLPKDKNYRITQKVKKRRTKLVKPDKDGYIPFLAVAPSNGRVLPFQRKQDSNKIEKVFKTISLPQMVDNKETRTTMNKNLGELLHSRFNHHLKRYLGENTK